MIPTPAAAGIQGDARRQIADLQVDATRRFAYAAFALAALWFTRLAVQVPNDRPAAWVAALLLFADSLLSAWLLERKPRVAQLAFPLLLIATLGLFLWLSVEPLLPFMIVPVVLMPSVSLPRRGFVVLNLLADAMLLSIGLAKGGGTLSSAYQLALAASIFTFMVSWMATRYLYTAVNWAMASGAEANEHMREARARRGELRRLADALRHNQERMHDLNVRLEQARVAAEEAYRTKQHFVANVSHELRTPLNLITGFSEMMTLSPESYGGVLLPAEYRQDMTEIYRSSKHLLGLVEDVLALAQLEAGEMLVKRDWIDLNLVVSEAAETMRPLIEAKGLALCLDLDAELPPVLIDAGRVRQILLNLMNNAYRYTRDGHIAVRVRRSEREACVEVADTGAGIRQEDLSHIFEAFRMLNRGPTAPRTEGFGLGLSISRRLVEAHGGSLGVDSTVGAGSRFTMTLPLETPSRLEQPILVRTGWPRDHRVNKPTLMIVSDEPGGLFDDQLGRFTIVPARPNEAAALCQHHVPAAVWVDASAAQASPGLMAPVSRAMPSLPIITSRIPGQRDVARRLQADRLMPKPITKAGLERMLASVTDEHHPVRHILVIDDNAQMTRLVERTLASCAEGCYQVSAACGGREGLLLLARRAPDLVLLDLDMPEVSGADVLSAMRDDDAYRETVVVLMTGLDIQQELPPIYGIQVSSQAGFSLPMTLRVIEHLAETLSPRTL